MIEYDLISENPESTVISMYELPTMAREDTYQSEADLENELIKQLKVQGYEYLSIRSEAELIDNLRRQLERLNDYAFTDSEWKRFFTGNLSNANLGIEEKTILIQEDHVQLLERDNGNKKNIYLIDKERIHNNRLQVINQYIPEGGRRENRYDVTILINGFPLVHVELKRRGVSIREAFNQINRYQRDSFWAGCGLFEYAQIFVISNGTHTRYYSNTTRHAHIREMQQGPTKKSTRRTSNSYEFTGAWATRENRPLDDLETFTQTFFARHTLLNILIKYCVLTADKLLLVMRPYQIAAAESILNRVRIACNHKRFGTVHSGGYIWHTTGSGKTLTSFKVAQLATKMPDMVDKVIFVVDRKDLDYQTMKEYDRFEKGAANGNSNTAVLKKQLEDPNVRIIITTIQKLSIFIKQNPKHEVYRKKIALIFDECHHSQFGEMHRAITAKFKAYYLFGFTGTPIFAANAATAAKNLLKTTEQAFGDRLHIYTIVNAIADKNVLPFRVDYVKTIRQGDHIRNEKVRGIDQERALLSPVRISNITGYILEHFAMKTKRNERAFNFNKITNTGELATARNRAGVEEKRVKVRMTGFNSIFAVASIEAAKLYYAEFKRQQESLTPAKRLNIALIYSYGANEAEVEDGLFDEENPGDTDGLDQSSRDFLDAAIADYNALFGCNYDTSADKFQNYYRDVSLRMKNREIDLLIVVNMFLTGFDATTLNTLWVDKNLRMHGLLQAYSRTNRILNSVKTFGNIICFRNLEKETNESLALFGDKDAKGIVILRPFTDYYEGYTDEKGKKHPGYREMVTQLLDKYPIGTPLLGEGAKKGFIRHFGTLLRMRNLLSAFDQFQGNELMSDRDLQDYQSMYLDLYDEFRGPNDENVNINDDLVFEMELIKQVEVGIDYILLLIKNMHDKHTDNKEIQIKIKNAIAGSPDLRDKKELIEEFVNGLKPDSNVDGEWNKYVKVQQSKQLEEIITEENLKPEETRQFISCAFRDGGIQESGTALVKILPPMSIFDTTREEKKAKVTHRLKQFFSRFFYISGGKMECVER